MHLVRTLHEDWWATMCTTASGLMNHSLDDPFAPGVVGVLAPVGAGHQVHAQMCVRLLTRLLTTPDGEPWLPDGITRHELAVCWFYGYYLRACEMSLPDDARTSLA
jgi:hypothetical protein